MKLITIPKSSFSLDRELREASSFLQEDSDASSFLFCILMVEKVEVRQKMREMGDLAKKIFARHFKYTKTVISSLKEFMFDSAEVSLFSRSCCSNTINSTLDRASSFSTLEVIKVSCKEVISASMSEA